MAFLDVLCKRCPRCDKRGLRLTNALRWSGRDDDGQSAGGMRSYYKCPHCQARLVGELNDELEDVADEEWEELGHPNAGMQGAP